MLSASNIPERFLIGRIEYHNKLIRQYIPKETDFNDISDQMINR